LNTKALTPESQNGQFGLSAQATYGDYDVGLFVERYDAKAPVAALNIQINPATFAAGGNYHFIYPRDIWLYGASLSTTVGIANVSVSSIFAPRTAEHGCGSERPARRPHAADAAGRCQWQSGLCGRRHDVGILNATYVTKGFKLDPGGVTALAELTYVDLWRVTANKALLTPGRSHAASAINVSLAPSYYNVLPNLTLQLPVTFQYDYAGNSAVDGGMTHGNGSYSFGVTATYRQSWDAALTYVGNFGKPQQNSGVDRSYVRSISRIPSESGDESR